jgi:asparagine synthase (glutamine-hydrolysing)
MCGLYASVGLPIQRQRLDRVAHRGPHGEGWVEMKTQAGPLMLGHRRLAIIDLSEQASQPMGTPNGDHVLIFNGEIYNYLELKAQLIQQGARFATQSDCEVLLHGLSRWGEAILPQLRGMFSFVYFDKARQRLTIGRDGYGIKPLCYYQNESGIAFASEQKQIYDMVPSGAKLNVSQTWDYLQAQITDHSAQTLFADVHHLKPGHVISLDLAIPPRHWVIEQRPWFATPSVNGPALSAAAAATEFRALFEQSIERHLRADVPVGACLSGGLDSSIVVAIANARKKSPLPLETFTAVFPEAAINEQAYAQAMADHIGAKPHFVTMSDDQVSRSLDAIVWHQDEPFGSTSILAQYFVFDAIAATGLRVVLDGQGADEQLAGYHGVFPFHRAALLRQGKIGELIGLLAGLKRHHGVNYNTFVAELGKHALSRLGLARLGLARLRLAHLGFGQSGDPNQPDPLARGLVADYAPRSGSALQRLVDDKDLPALRTIGELCLAMMMGGNLQMLLRYEDRNSMAHGVEARVPFLDTDLAAFSLGLGDQHKLVGGITKSVARQAMADVLPKKIFERQSKLGFAAPEDRWMRGPLRAHVEAGLTAGEERFTPLLDWDAARVMLRNMDNTDTPVEPMLWRLANLGLWAKRFDVTL